MKWWFRLPLYSKIFVMLILGIVVGYALGPEAKVLKPIGDAFVRLLRMLIVPLVFFTLVSGITKMESPASLRKVGAFIGLYYIATSTFAAAVGLTLGLIFRPGLGVQGLLGNAPEMKSSSFSFIENMINWIPANPVQAMAEANMLQIIFFSLLIGISLLFLGDRVKLISKFFSQGSDMVIRLTEMVMELSPYGIFALVANMVGTLGNKMLAAVAKFVIADYIGLLVMVLVVYPLFLKAAKIPILHFFKSMFPVFVVAASTTSSAAALPVEMKVAKERLGVPEKIFGFTLPLGNTANMDGTAVVLGLIGIFALDIFNIPIEIGLLVQIVYLGLALSIGAAGVKGGGIVMSAILFESLGLPQTLLPIIAAIWPLLDPGQTTTNVTGDVTGTVVCAARYNEIDWSPYPNSEQVSS